MTSPAGARWVRARWASPPASTTWRHCELPARPTFFKTSQTPAPCSRRCSRERAAQVVDAAPRPRAGALARPNHRAPAALASVGATRRHPGRIGDPRAGAGRRGTRGDGAAIDSRDHRPQRLDGRLGQRGTTRGALARLRLLDSARRSPRVAWPHPRRLRARPSMARGTAGLLALVLSAAIAAAAPAQLRLVEVPVTGRASLDSLARLGFEVADVRLVNGTLRATLVVSPETESRLTVLGFRVAIPTLARVSAGAVEDTFRSFHSFDNPANGIRATLNSWAAADSLIHVDSVGASYEGRPILAVKIGAAADDPARANVLFLATHHAREWISTAVAMKLIRWLADSAGAALATHDVWVIPVENPDGYQYTFTNERYWRKNRRPN